MGISQHNRSPLLSKMLWNFVKIQKITEFTSTASFHTISQYVTSQPRDLGQLKQWEMIDEVPSSWCQKNDEKWKGIFWIQEWRQHLNYTIEWQFCCYNWKQCIWCAANRKCKEMDKRRRETKYSATCCYCCR